jgi:hypothetical protein
MELVTKTEIDNDSVLGQALVGDMLLVATTKMGGYGRVSIFDLSTLPTLTQLPNEIVRPGDTILAPVSRGNLIITPTIMSGSVFAYDIEDPGVPLASTSMQHTPKASIIVGDYLVITGRTGSGTSNDTTGMSVFDISSCYPQ